MTRSASMIRVGNIIRLNDVFSSLNLDPIPLWETLGLKASIFDDPEALIPVSLLDKMLTEGARITGCDHLGLLVGRMPTNLGLPGFLALNAPTIREGLVDLVSLHDTTNESAEMKLIETAESATLCFSMLDKSTRASVQIADGAMSQSYNLLQKMSGNHFKATLVRLPRSAPKDIRPFLVSFPGETIVFNAAQAAIEFSVQVLDQPVVNANPDLYKFLKRELGQNRSSTPATLAQNVRRALATLVFHQELSRDIVSGLFGMHYKTMTRLLAKEDTALQDLIDRAKYDAACQLLRDTDLSISEISDALHYAEPSSFSRSFRRVAGITPREWRHNMQSE